MLLFHARYQLNPTKCKEIVINFNRRSNDVVQKKVINGDVIERINSIKVLGVYLNNELSWKDHIDYIYKKASKRVYYIIFLKWSGLQGTDLCKVHCSAICSVLEYAAPVWFAGITQE